MYVIKLPNGNLLVPESALDAPGGITGDAYIEIGPEDREYQRLAEGAMGEQEFTQRRRRWQEADEALGREFEAFRAARLGRGQAADTGDDSDG